MVSLVSGSGDWEVSLEFLVSSFWFRVAGFGFSRVERVERGERMGMWYRWLVDREIGRMKWYNTLKRQKQSFRKRLFLWWSADALSRCRA